VEDERDVIYSDTRAELSCTGREFRRQNYKLPGGARGTSGGGALETAGSQRGSGRARHYEERRGRGGKTMKWQYRDVDRSFETRQDEVVPGDLECSLGKPGSGLSGNLSISKLWLDSHVTM
jgi:hypothetical protein